MVTTPNSLVVDTLAMDKDHVTPLTPQHLFDMDYDAVNSHCLFPGTEYNPQSLPDTLVAWWVTDAQ